jgi:glycosyltransferase involved in cell wall biosynthesis
MKIAFFSTMAGQPWGGSEELWSRAADVLLSRGHDVCFNTLAWPVTPAPLQRLIERGARARFRRRWRIGRSLRTTLQKLHLTKRKYRNWLQKHRPDLVLASFACHTDDPQIAIACRDAAIPYAILLQAAGSHSWIDPRSLDDFRAAYAHAERCYFVSAENREVIESNLATELPYAEIVDNPFNVRFDAAPGWPSASPHWKLACVARVNYATKGQDLIARVLRMSKWRRRPLQVAIWGSDNGNLKQLRQSICHYGISEQLVYKGVSNDIEQLWADHHGLLLPSRAEGNALSLIEAMMCGRVPITTNVGRACELIDNNECGFIAPAATFELIDEALERAWQRRADWQSIGQRAAGAIRARHSLNPAEDFADRIIEVAQGSRHARCHLGGAAAHVPATTAI